MMPEKVIANITDLDPASQLPPKTTLYVHHDGDRWRALCCSIHGNDYDLIDVAYDELKLDGGRFINFKKYQCKHVVPVDCGGDKRETCLEKHLETAIRWITENVDGYWSWTVITFFDHRFSFENPDDAILFSMKFH